MLKWSVIQHPDYKAEGGRINTNEEQESKEKQEQSLSAKNHSTKKLNCFRKLQLSWNFWPEDRKKGTKMEERTILAPKCWVPFDIFC